MSDERTKKIIIHESDCILIIRSDMSVKVNVPTKSIEDEIPTHAMYTVALTHLINEGNEVLAELLKHKWNALVDMYNGSKNG